MNSIFATVCLLVSTILFQYPGVDGTVYKICENAQKRCPGHMLKTNGVTGTPKNPFLKLTVKNIDECSYKCVQTPACLMALFLPKGSTKHKIRCNLYNVQDFKPGINNQTILYWKCCDLRQVCMKPYETRCNGYWLRSNHTVLQMPRRDPVGRDGRILLNDAFDKCLNNAVCGSINFQYITPHSLTYGSAQLNQKWPVSNLTLKPSENQYAYQWICCNRDYSPNASVCLNVTGRCSGNWAREDKSQQPPTSAPYVIQFYTLSAQDCWTECQLQGIQCQRAWYSQNNSLCSLEAAKNIVTGCAAKYSKPLENVFMIPWKWKCCSTNKINDNINYVTSLEKLSEKDIGITKWTLCICIQNSSRVRLSEDNCHNVNLNQPRQPIDGMAFFVQNLSSTLNLNSLKWQQMFDGYDKLWLAQVESGGISSCAMDQCHLYSGALIRNETCDNFLVKRKQWFAQNPSKAPLPKFPNKPYVIVIGGTDEPQCGCYTMACSSDQVRRRQTADMTNRHLPDIGTHFLIDSAGHVFSGRDVYRIGHLPVEDTLLNAAYNTISLSVTFIGHFDIDPPTLAAVTAAKRLISCSITQGWLSSKYSVLGLRDLELNSSAVIHSTNVIEELNGYKSQPGRKLYGIIHNWPYYRDRQHSPTNCSSTSTRLPIWSIVLLAVIGGLVVVGGSVGLGVVAIRRYQVSSGRPRLRINEACCAMQPMEDEESFI